MPLLRHERAPYRYKRVTNYDLERHSEHFPKPAGFEQSLAQLKDVYGLCLGQPHGLGKRQPVAGGAAVIDLANSAYFDFERELSHSDQVFAALGWQWYHKLDLLTNLASAVQNYAISHSLNPDDEALRGRWRESFSIAFLAECLSRTVGYSRPSEAWVAGTLLLALGFAESCRLIEKQPARSRQAIAHLDAREPVVSLPNLEKLVRQLELGRSFSTARTARCDLSASPWPSVAAACFLEVSAHRNSWVAEIAVELKRAPLSVPLHRILARKTSEIAGISGQMALISWKAALGNCWQEIV